MVIIVGFRRMDWEGINLARLDSIPRNRVDAGSHGTGCLDVYLLVLHRNEKVIKVAGIGLLLGG